MTRVTRTRRTQGALGARLAAVAGVVVLSSGWLFAAAPASAAAPEVVETVLSAQCEDDGYRIGAEGSFILDATTVKSFVTVDGDSGRVRFASTEPGTEVQAAARSVLITDEAVHHVEWSVNGEIVAEGDFTRAEACGSEASSPSVKPTPTDSPTQTPSDSPMPAESPDPTASPEPAPSDSPTPSESPEPSVPTEEPSPVESPESPEEEPAPAPVDESAPVEEVAPVAAVPSVALSSESVPAATSVTVTASGFIPGEVLELWLHSDPWLLTTTTADADGAISLSVKIAGGTEIGDHQIEVRGAASGSVFVDVTVTDDLAITGIDSVFASGVATTGLVLVLGGAAIVLLGCRASATARNER